MMIEKSCLLQMQYITMNLTKKQIVKLMKEDPSRVTFDTCTEKTKFAQNLRNVRCNGNLQKKVIFCTICQKILCNNANTIGNMPRHFKLHNSQMSKSFNMKEIIRKAIASTRTDRTNSISANDLHLETENDDDDHCSRESQGRKHKHSKLSIAQKRNLEAKKGI